VDYPHRNIRFTSTDDGVDIAFWEIGEGKPLLIIQNFGLSHAELEWGRSVTRFVLHGHGGAVSGDPVRPERWGPIG